MLVTIMIISAMLRLDNLIQQDVMSVHTLQEQAYPVTVGAIQMNWNANEFAKLAVAFAYRDYKVVYGDSIRNQTRCFFRILFW